MEESDWALLQKLYDAYAQATLTDILLILLLLIPLIYLLSIPYFRSLRKQYRKDVEIFEAENPHLKGQYFSFWKWFDVRDGCGNISNKYYKKRFGEEAYVNTDHVLFQLKQLKEATKGFGKNFSLLTKTLIILLVIIFASALV